MDQKVRAAGDALAGPLPRGKTAQKKRSRKSRSRGLRTKTGCLTCRSRHKKCDEKMPICGPCSISNRDCVYADSSNPAAIPIAKPSTSPPGLATIEELDTSKSPSQLADNASTHVSDHTTPAYHSQFELTARDVQSQARGAGSAQHCEETPHQFSCSPETVASDLLTADLASTRWLDLLATDAAQADGTFSLAPSPEPTNTTLHSVVPGVSAVERSREPQYEAYNDVTAERGQWQSSQDIALTNQEALLFRHFTQRAARWLDLFDPFKNFSNYATRLALRNLGLLRAILALAARHNAMVQARSGNQISDHSQAIQYYYETLLYVQTALKYNSYVHSEELLGTAIVISTYEMLDESDSNWQRHLKGVFWIQRSQNVNGASTGLRQAVWWAWLRQDLWAAFRERRRCFSFWRPVKDLNEMTEDELADNSIFLLSQAVNYCADSPTALPSDAEATARQANLGDLLMGMLERWKSFLTPKFNPLPTVAKAPGVFEPLWIHPPQYGVAIQAYNFARILITLHRPAILGIDGYMKTQRILSDAVNTICGIAMELEDEGCQIVSAQCLFGAGLCAQDDARRETIISLIEACEARTGWHMEAMRDDLRAEWAKSA
ncbi:hypothetical protein F5Y08DRAFT_312401 [Xylaria arbuscula]|nr:hypothetical protein F5Y08DRAFT_312401 [Xylaria arbuscula]